MFQSKNDVESGTRTGALYPNMIESPEMRWRFIRKVYSILAMQLLMTVAVASVVIFVKPISVFFAKTTAGLIVWIALLILPFILLGLLACYRYTHPVNFLLLTLFTVTLAFSIGLACAFTKGRIILEAAILTAVVVVSLTLYTFWAVRRGQDFNRLGPFLFASLMVLICFGLIQIFLPLGKLSMMIYGGISAIVFCGFIVYDTDNLIKNHSYDDYIWASVALYLDVLNLFLALVNLLNGAD